MKKLIFLLLCTLMSLNVSAQIVNNADTANYQGIKRFDTYDEAKLSSGVKYRLEAYRNDKTANVRVVFYQGTPSQIVMTYASIKKQIEKLEEFSATIGNISSPDHDIVFKMSAYYTDGISVTYQLCKSWDEPNLDYAYFTENYVNLAGDLVYVKPKGLGESLAGRHNLKIYIDNLKELKKLMEDFSKKYNYPLGD